MISIYLIRPFTVELGEVRKLTSLLKRNKLNLPGVKKLEQNVLKEEEVHLENSYCRNTGIDVPSNIPYVGLLKGMAGNHRFHIRESGICSFISVYTVNDTLSAPELATKMHQLEREQKRVSISEVLSSISKKLEVNKGYFKPGKTLFLVHLDRDMKYVQSIASHFGVGKRFVGEVLVNQVRFVSKPLYVLSTSNGVKPQSRKILRRRIIHGIVLAHGINQFIMRAGRDFKEMDRDRWDILLNCWNPLMLSGRGNIDSPLTSLAQAWFNRTSKILDLRRRFRDLLIDYLAHTDTSAYQMLNIVSALRTLKINVAPRILPAIGHSTLSMDEDESKIYTILRDRFNAVKQDITTSNYPYGAGMLRSEIVRELGMKPGRKNISVTNALDRLVRKYLINEEPYHGPGRGKNNKIYSLRLKEYEYKSEMVEYIKQKLPEELDDIPIDIGWFKDSAVE